MEIVAITRDMHRFCISVLFLVTTGRTATSFAWSRTAIDCSGHHRYACPPSSSTYADAVSELRAQLALQQEGCCGGSPGRGEHVTAPGNAEVCFEAYVSRRRPMGSGLAFLDLVDPTDEDAPELTALLKRQAFEPGSSADGAADPAAFAAYSKALQPGTLLRLVGTAAPTRTGEASLLVRRVTVLAAAPNPQVRARTAFAVRGHWFVMLSLSLSLSHSLCAGSKPHYTVLA